MLFIRTSFRVRLYFLFFMLIFSAISITACSSWKKQQGVTNKWRDNSLPEFEIGKTRQSEIGDLLGPPSQIIGLGDNVIFYYMLEYTEGKGVFLIFFNWADQKVKYDRAIFFFDKNGVLTDYSYSLEANPYEKTP